MSVERKIGIHSPGQNAKEKFGTYGIDLQIPTIKRLFEAASDISNEDMFSFLEKDPLEKLHQSKFAQVFVLTTSIAYYHMASERLPLHLNPSNIVVAGHSQGEYTGLVIAQSLDFEQAVKLIYCRGVLLDEESKRHPQTMLVINGQPLEVVGEICSSTKTEIANENSDEQFVIAGLVECINRAEKLIRKHFPQRNTNTIRIPIKVGSHCSLEEAPALEMAKHLESEDIKDPIFHFISNSTGDFITTSQEIKTHLIDQLTNRVLWRQTVRRMLDSGVREFYEIGPQNILTKLTIRIAKRDGLIDEVTALSTKEILQQPKTA